MRRVVFLNHLDASAAVLSVVDVSTFHKSQADVRMPQAVRRSRSAFAIEAKILFVEDGFEKLALPLGKDEVVGFRHAPLFVKGSGGHGGSCGRVHAICARRAEPASKSFKSSKGLTALGILLQYPTPRFPRTSISKIICV